MEYHPHTGFHYCKLVTYVCHEYGSFSSTSGMEVGGSGYGQVSNFHPN